MRFPTRKRILAAIVFLVASLALVLVIYTLAVRNAAENILADVSKIKVGTSTLTDVERMGEKHKRYLNWKGRDGEESHYSFEVRNTWLSYLRIEPQARFNAWVTLKDGTVQSLHVSLMRDTRIFPTAGSGGMVEEYVQYPSDYREGDTHYGFRSPIGKLYLWVALDRQATEVQRQHAYTLSLTCLVKPGSGCDLPCDYLPLAWKDWEAELSAKGWGFGDYYPTRSRCK